MFIVFKASDKTNRPFEKRLSVLYCSSVDKRNQDMNQSDSTHWLAVSDPDALISHCLRSFNKKNPFPSLVPRKRSEARRIFRGFPLITHQID